MKPKFNKISFRPYLHPNNLCPIQIVTPTEGEYIHTFFDVNPISPSGRYLACIKLPFAHRLPKPEDEADICIIDLHEQAMALVYKTKGWGLCVSAHVCWGSDDNHLYFNDKEGAEVFAVEYNLNDGSYRRLCGPIYQISKDGEWIFSPNLAIVNYAQKGYGAVVDEKYGCVPTNVMSDDEGLWRLNASKNTKELIFSKKDAYNILPDKKPIEGSRMVFFHTKISPDQTKLMQMIRCTFDNSNKQLRYIITMDLDGKNPKLALPFELWLSGSHHPDWHPDSLHITMNINFEVMRFCQFKYDGSEFKIIFPHLRGGGHPSFSKDTRFLITDAYTNEPFSNEEGQTPIRFINSQTGEERVICYINTLSNDTPFDLRCDPHPVWNKDCTKIIFNATPNGNRQILIADVSELVK